MRKTSLLVITLAFIAVPLSGQQKAFSCDYTGLIHEQFSTGTVPSGSKYFYMHNYYYLGYFDDPSKKYIVHRFDEKGVE